MKKQVLRIIDVNLNRTREGLRVCEEITRFILQDKKLTERFKHLRHRLSKNTQRLPGMPQVLLRQRDSQADIGKKIKNLIPRNDHRDIFFANIHRAEESLRVLEEFSQLFDRSLAESFARLRFAVYHLEKKTIERL